MGRAVIEAAKDLPRDVKELISDLIGELPPFGFHRYMCVSAAPTPPPFSGGWPVDFDPHPLANAASGRGLRGGWAWSCRRRRCW
jgi:hypothetical protein